MDMFKKFKLFKFFKLLWTKIINKKFQRYKIRFSFNGNHGQVFRSFKLLLNAN